MKKGPELLLITASFAVAMGFLESAVVVYLREIYYPGGFAFPVKPILGRVAVTEVIREAATMVMLFTLSLLAVRGTLRRFSVFIFAFAVWDLTYYLFLYFLLGWPPSLLTWDILFLIPVTWVGPVLAPVINSLTMILLAVVLLARKSRDPQYQAPAVSVTLLAAGSLITIAAYTKPYLDYMFAAFPASEIFRLQPSGNVMEHANYFIPEHFPWLLFLLAELLFLAAIFLLPLNKRSTPTNR